MSRHDLYVYIFNDFRLDREEDQGREADRGDGRRRDDEDHLADDQGQTHLSLSRCRMPLLRLGTAIPRPDQ